VNIPPISLKKPGLFVTGTDTGVGKTVVACAIAAALRRQGARRVGVCKPLATGCRRDREGLVSEDAEALAHFADCSLPLDVINPVRYLAPVAPAVAAEASGQPVDFANIARCLAVLDDASDALLVEGVGGVMVPIDGDNPKVNVIDLIRAVGYPVVVVTRATLGTLNHTALTVGILRAAGCRVAGLVINGFDADSSAGTPGRDLAMSTNRDWLRTMNDTPILATLPACPPGNVAANRGIIPAAILESAALAYWGDVAEVQG
jgi:dethiobiotin synthetase